MWTVPGRVFEPQMHERVADDPAAAAADRSRLISRVDADLFAAWKAGDAVARNEAWRRLWTSTYSWVVPFCRTMAPDDLAAQEWAADAINAVHAELEKLLAGGFTWRGEPQFAGMFANYVKRRCLDRCRAFMRTDGRNADIRLESEGVEADLPSSPPVQESEAVDLARTREAVDDLVCRLARRREVCGSRRALVDIIDAMLAYLRECCLRAVVTVDAATAAPLTLDQLVPLIDRQAVVASSSEMSEFIMAHLGIDRPTLDNRNREIRKLLLVVQAERTSGLGKL